MRADPAHEAGYGLAELIWAILLKEMASFHRHFGLIRPGAAAFALPPHQNGTRIVEEELWDIGLREPGGIAFNHFHQVCGLALDRNHSRPCQRRSAVFAGPGKRLAVDLHLLLAKLADDELGSTRSTKHRTHASCSDQTQRDVDSPTVSGLVQEQVRDTALQALHPKRLRKFRGSKLCKKAALLADRGKHICPGAARGDAAGRCPNLIQGSRSRTTFPS